MVVQMDNLIGLLGIRKIGIIPSTRVKGFVWGEEGYSKIDKSVKEREYLGTSPVGRPR